jgi:hypothetical protein
LPSANSVFPMSGASTIPVSPASQNLALPGPATTPTAPASPGGPTPAVVPGGVNFYPAPSAGGASPPVPPRYP